MLVKVIIFPPNANGEKTGVDDYLKAGHTVNEMLALAVEVPSAPAGSAEVISEPTYVVEMMEST